MLTMAEVGVSPSLLLVVLIQMILLSAAYSLSFNSSNLFLRLIQLTAVILDKYTPTPCLMLCWGDLMESMLVIFSLAQVAAS